MAGPLAEDACLLVALRAGVPAGTARRGSLTADGVINTWPFERLTAFLHAKRGTT